MNVVRLWFLATALLVAGGLIWSFAPILVPMIAITLGLGGVVVATIALAQWVDRNRGQR